MNYQTGVSASFQIGAIAGLIPLFATIVIIVYHMAVQASALHKGEGLRKKIASSTGGSLAIMLFFIPLMLIISLLFGISAQLLSYNILNVMLNCQSITIDTLIRHELSSGVLSLRLTSLIIGLKISGLTLGMLKDFCVLDGERQIIARKPSRFIAIRQLSPFCDDVELCYCLLFQYGIYMVVLYSLWLFRFQSINSLSISMMNWLLFFIIDDWVIIAHYLQELKGRIANSHICRLALTNGLLITCLLYNAIRFLNIYYIAVLSVLMLFLAVGFWFRFINEILLVSVEDKLKRKEERYEMSLSGF